MSQTVLTRSTGHGARDLPATVMRYVEANFSANTKTAYLRQWDALSDWAAHVGIRELPLSPENLARHLAEQADLLDPVTGHWAVSMSTLSQRVAAVGAVHRANGFSHPGDSALVRAVLSGVASTRRESPKRMRPLTLDRLLVVLQAMDYQSYPVAVGAIRDRALLLAGFAGALRRSEIVSIRWKHLETVNDGVRLLIPHSKTDQSANGETLFLPRGRKVLTCAPCALIDWLSLVTASSRSSVLAAIWKRPTEHRCGETHFSSASGLVFHPVTKHGVILDRPLSGAGVHDVVRRRMAAAGFDPAGFGGHSLRAGFVTTAHAQGVEVSRIATQSRHRRVETLQSYVRHENPQIQNAVTSLGL